VKELTGLHVDKTNRYYVVSERPRFARGQVIMHLPEWSTAPQGQDEVVSTAVSKSWRDPFVQILSREREQLER
jgi:hypothetical protein